MFKYLFFALLFVACHSTQNTRQPMRPIQFFEKCITGDFDNQKQVADEKKAGQQLHPLARHINRNATHRIKNAPKVDGFWLLEESYYSYPGKETQIKPFLFLFEAVGESGVRLTPYQLPDDLPLKNIVNSDPDLRFDYLTLKPSPTFKPAMYTFRDHAFHLNAANDLGKGMRFTLIETINDKQLIVMELLEKDGKRMTPYETPIVYDRK